MKHRKPPRLFSLVVGLLLVSAGIARAVETNGFLVFEVERLAQSNGAKASDIRQRFEVPLTGEFMSSFKEVPNQHSSGTGFWCGVRNFKATDDSTGFMWWIRKTTDNRWSINMWGEGTETINGARVSSRNAKASQDLIIRGWADLDMRYMLTYGGNFSPSSLNVSFRARFVSAKEIKADGPIHAAPVQRADGSELFKGDDLSALPLQIRCGFQE